MSFYPGSDVQAAFPFVGLMPTRAARQAYARSRAASDARRDSRRQNLTLGFAATMPIVLVGTLAMTALHPTVPAPVKSDLAEADATGMLALDGARVSPDSDGPAALSIQAAPADVPASYVVKQGDTIPSIAAEFGLSTASVLALNGLSWSSMVFPNQTLRLTKSTTDAMTQPAAVDAQAAAAATAIAAAPQPAAAAKPATPAPPVVHTAPVTASAVSFSYTIVSGDTISSIASRFGVTSAAILAANGLTPSSIIYAGRKLTIPGVTGPAAGSSTSSGTSSTAGTGSTTETNATIVAMSPSMEANAKIIVSVGTSLGVPSYGIVIALAAAAQESGMENLTYGDLDSVGLFQQRPSAGWGTVAQLENPTYASELFYGGPSNPNKGRTRGLLDIPGWQSMTVTQAAQAVQDSAYPNAYAKWEASARAWLAELQ